MSNHTFSVSSAAQVEDAGKRLKATRVAAHPDCLICSSKGRITPHLLFEADENGAVRADFHCTSRLQGYPGWLHGGAVSAILDAAMTNCLFARGISGVTARLSVRFREPVEVGDIASARAWVARESPRLLELRGEVIQRGRVKVTAEGKFMRMKPRRPKVD